MATTRFEICNMALARIGAGDIVDFTTAPHGPVCALFYDEVRRAVLLEEAWRFALRDADLVWTPLVEGATATASDHRVSKSAGDFDATWPGDTVYLSGAGLVDGHYAVSAVAGDGSYIECPALDDDGAEVLVYLARLNGGSVMFGYPTSALPVPPLRVVSATSFTGLPLAWALEADRLYADYGEVRVRYVGDIEDTTLFPAVFVQAFVPRLAAAMCMRIKPSQGLYDRLVVEYEQALLRARQVNAVGWDNPSSDEEGGTAWLDARGGGVD